MCAITPRKQVLGKIKTGAFTSNCTEPGALLEQDGAHRAVYGNHGQATSLSKLYFKKKVAALTRVNTILTLGVHALHNNT